MAKCSFCVCVTTQRRMFFREKSEKVNFIRLCIRCKWNLVQKWTLKCDSANKGTVINEITQELEFSETKKTSTLPPVSVEILTQNSLKM